MMTDITLQQLLFAKQLYSLGKKFLRMPLDTLQDSLLQNINFSKTQLDN